MGISCSSMLELRYFATEAGRSAAIDFLASLPVRERAQIVADLEAYRIYGWNAPISCKPLKGHRPLFEVRTGGHRAYCVATGQVVWVLHVGRKQDQRRDIAVAAERMKKVLRRLG